MTRIVNRQQTAVPTALAAAALAGVLLLGSCAQDSSREKKPLDLLSVSVTNPRFREVSDSFSIIGSVQASNEVTVLSETSGKIIEMTAKTGATVAAGTPLVRVDKDLREAAFIAAEATYTKAAKDAERVDALHADKLISDAEIEAARLGEATARSQYLVAKKELENTTICSTIGGTIADTYVSLGEQVRRGQPDRAGRRHVPPEGACPPTGAKRGSPSRRGQGGRELRPLPRTHVRGEDRVGQRPWRRNPLLPDRSEPPRGCGLRAQRRHVGAARLRRRRQSKGAPYPSYGHQSEASESLKSSLSSTA